MTKRPLRVVHEHTSLLPYSNVLRMKILEQLPHWRTILVQTPGRIESRYVKLPYVQYYYVSGLENKVHNDRKESLGISFSNEPLENIYSKIKLFVPPFADLSPGYGPVGSGSSSTPNSCGAWACLPDYWRPVAEECIDLFWSSPFRCGYVQGCPSAVLIEGSSWGTGYPRHNAETRHGSFPGIGNMILSSMDPTEQRQVYLHELYKFYPELKFDKYECHNLREYVNLLYAQETWKDRKNRNESG